MEFKIEQYNNGRSNVIFNNYKCRVSFASKSGQILWRCLRKNCIGTSISMDTNKSCTININTKHSGPHHVTMRLLSSTPAIGTRYPVDTLSPTSVTREEHPRGSMTLHTPVLNTLNETTASMTSDTSLETEK